MKKILQWIGMILLLLVIGLVFGTIARKDRIFDGPYPKINATTDSATIARGRYLVMGPAHCADCHANPGNAKDVAAGIEVPLSGGAVFDLPPGKIYPRNITPDKQTGIGRFTDDQLARSLRYGIGTDGRAMFDIMSFHHVSDEDLASIFSYLRSTPPVNNQVPDNQYTVLGNILRAFMLVPAGPTIDVPVSVKRDTTAEYGKYLAFSVANCRGCHTNRDLKTGAFIGKEYAGGFEMEAVDNPKIILTTPNLSPDPKTGRIYGWSRDTFIKRFREGKKIQGSPMPWGPFSRMDEGDIVAIYKYLQTITPYENEISEFVKTLK